MSDAHIPVLKAEVIRGLNIAPGKRYIDATVGAGGHTTEILFLGGLVLGIDQDEYALDLVRKKHEGIKNLRLVHGNFRQIEEIATKNGFFTVSGILFDLGVSSMQLDTPHRGFSYRFEHSSLDMRMDESIEMTAADIINNFSKQELYDIISQFGEEKLAGVISDAIGRARSIKPIETVGDLVAIVKPLVPNERMRFGVLARVFQAIRIATNSELTALRQALSATPKLLEKGGRLVVISFHSLEDRIVKQYLRNSNWRLVNKHPLLASEQEQMMNKRSRSAKLRIAEKIV